MTLTDKQLEAILKDPEKAAQFYNLTYVYDNQLTIDRRKHGKGFRYFQNDKPVTKKDLINRIKSLVIPPAWTDVRITDLENGHLQVVGRDEKHRKVYKYHDLWTAFRNQTKFLKMSSFGNSLPLLRKQVEKDLQQEHLTKSKVLAIVITLLEETHIRIGNYYYAKNNNTYGLSTLRTKHVEHIKDSIQFHFIGKKNKEHQIKITDDSLIELVNQCEEIPGWELFQYFDEDGTKQRLDSGDINTYIKELSGELFTAKDFRTWSASKIFFETLRDEPYAEDENENKSLRLKAYDKTAEALGNTRSVCREYYVHPMLNDSYKDGSIKPYFSKLKKMKKSSIKHLSQTEEVLLEMISDYEISLEEN